MPLRFLPLVFLLTAAPAGAAVIEALSVAHQEQRYEVDLFAVLDAPAPAAYAAFAEPANLPRINPSVKRVQVLGRSSAGLRVYTEVQVCSVWYCRSLHQLQDMRFAPRADGGAMHAALLPQQGDFRFGEADWDFQAVDAKTRLHFHADLEPTFWVPPVVGPWLIGRALRREAENTCAGIERLARPPAP